MQVYLNNIPAEIIDYNDTTAVVRIDSGFAYRHVEARHSDIRAACMPLGAEVEG